MEYTTDSTMHRFRGPRGLGAPGPEPLFEVMADISHWNDDQMTINVYKSHRWPKKT